MNHANLVAHLSTLFRRAASTQSMRWIHMLDAYPDGIVMTHIDIILCEDHPPARMTHVVRVIRRTPANRAHTVVDWVFEMDQSGPVDLLQYIRLDIVSTIHMHRRVCLSPNQLLSFDSLFPNQLLSFDSLFPEFDPAIQLIREYPAVRLALSVMLDHLTPVDQ